MISSVSTSKKNLDNKLGNMSKYRAICLTDRRPKVRGGTRQGRPMEEREALFYFSMKMIDLERTAFRY